MGKTVAVLQSNYIPWKGYFDIIHDVDLFIFYDEVQYTTRDWRNRNRIKSAAGVQWITVPVHASRENTILEAEISDEKWQKKHFNALIMNYSSSPYFKKYKGFFEYVYLECKWARLYELNRYLIRKISSDLLGIRTRFADSREFYSTGVKHEKLLSIVEAANAQKYISGPVARDYIIENDYAEKGIAVIWKDYSGYPQYLQQFGSPFFHEVSILDLLFNTGEDAPFYIWGWR